MSGSVCFRRRFGWWFPTPRNLAGTGDGEREAEIGPDGTRSNLEIDTELAKAMHGDKSTIAIRITAEVRRPSRGERSWERAK